MEVLGLNAISAELTGPIGGGAHCRLIIIKRDLYMKWFEPQNINEWFRRGLSLRLGILFVVILLMAATELRFGWIEKVVGSYLITTNDNRPESGAIWDLGHQTQSARKNLDEIVGDSQTSQKEARGAENFSQIFVGLSEESGISISAAHFRKLYDKLPTLLSQELLSPYTLLQLEAGGEWNRTYFAKREDGIRIYLLDRDNQVLKEVSITRDLAEYIGSGEVAITGTLNNFADFANHIYPPDLFFNVLESLPEELQRGVLSQPQMLLNTDGKLLNVGISSEEVGGSIAIGFEYQQGQTHKVVLVQGQLGAVEKLRERLAQWERNHSFSPGSEAPTEGGL